MAEFISDIFTLAEKGAKVVIHHLEFDATIISRELERVGLTWAQETWARIARAGVCTMDPGIGKWLRESSAMEIANSFNANTLKLVDVAEAVGVQAKSVDGRLHAAGFDARLHASVYRALVTKAKDSLVCLAN